MRSPQGEAWWRRRESNPRPEALLPGVYMLILSFGFSESGPPAGGLPIIPSPLILPEGQGNSLQTSLLVVACIRVTGKPGEARRFY